MALIKSKYPTEAEVPEEYKALYEERGGEWVLTQIEGLKTDGDVTRLQRALNAEKEAHKKTRGAFENLLDGRKPEEVQADLERIPELEAAAGKLDEGKLNTLVEARVKARITPIERERDQLKTQLTEKDARIIAFETKEKLGTIAAVVTAAAKKLKVQESAIEDVVLVAERLFDIAEDGKVTDSNGLSPEVWLTDQQARKPHWWGPSVGGGGRGGTGGGFPGNPWTADNWNVTKQGEVMRGPNGREKAEQMARAAGVEVGATRPRKK